MSDFSEYINWRKKAIQSQASASSLKEREEDIDLDELESISNLPKELEGRQDENGDASLYEQAFKAAFSSRVKGSVSGNMRERS